MCCISISGFLASATKKYTNSGGGGKSTFDLEAVVRICLLQFEKVKALLGDFTMEEIEAMKNIERMKWSNGLVNSILKSEAETDTFLQEERELTELITMTNSDAMVWEIQKEVGIIQSIRKTIRKIKFLPGAQKRKMRELRI